MVQTKKILKIEFAKIIEPYKWIAKKAGFPRAYRAVGTALKNNPYPLIIPCHRLEN